MSAQHVKSANDAKSREDKGTAPARADRFARIGDKHAAAGNHASAASAYGSAADRYKQAGNQAKSDEYRDKAGEHDELSHGSREDQARDDQGRFAKDGGHTTALVARARKRTKRVEFSHDTPAVKQAEAALSKKLAAQLKAIGKHLAAKLSRLAKPTKMSEEGDERDAIESADWAPIAAVVSDELEAVARAGAKQALAKLGIDDEDITSQTFTKAVDWARARAAELVGKSWDDDGELIDNPDAEMAITDTMRDDIREAVADAIEAGDSAAELSDTIEGLSAFSEARADMIARSEVVRSHASGQMTAMRESGVVKQKAWSTAGEDVCDECQDNEDEGPIDIDDDFPSGDDAPIAHPLCRCSVVAYFEPTDDSGAEEEDDSEDE